MATNSKISKTTNIELVIDYESDPFVISVTGLIKALQSLESSNPGGVIKRISEDRNDFTATIEIETLDSI